MKPLFERLCARQNEQVGSYFSLENLKESVIHEVSRILSTRYHVVGGMPSPAERTILDYGIASVTDSSSHNARHHAALANEIRLAIMSYEPRLIEPKIEMETPTSQYGILRCMISGRISNGLHYEEVRFPVSLSGNEVDG